MTFLSDNNIARRKAFAKEHKTKPITQWQSIRFTDEVHFALESCAATWVLRNDTERYHPTCIQYKNRNKGSQLYAQGMIGYGYKGPLLFFDSNDTSEPTDWIYEAISIDQDTPQPIKETEIEEARLLGDGIPSQCKHACKNKATCKHACCKPDSRPRKVAGNMTMEQYLTKIFKPYIEYAWQETKDQHKKFILFEDNNGSHGTKSDTNIVARYKVCIGIPWYANALRSPDLNIIENVWRILKQRLKQRLRSEKGALINRIKVIIHEIWDNIDQEEINRLVRSMPNRIDECLKRKGLNTPF